MGMGESIPRDVNACLVLSQCASVLYPKHIGLALIPTWDAVVRAFFSLTLW